MDIDLSKLNQLDFRSIGSWPFAGKAVVVAVLCGIVLALGYFLHLEGLREEFARLAQTEAKLLVEFEDKQKKAVSLDAYKQQMKEMEEAFGTMLRQLPSKNEVADLLVDVTQTGLAAGLTFDLFKPERESPHEFYAELPITIQVSGGYHNFGAFASGVAALPRIVTLQNITISSSGAGAQQRRGGDKGTDKGNSAPPKGGLVMKAMAKTYRYLDAEEIAAQEAAAAKARKGKKGKGRGKKAK